jgi:hypothetical protein
MNAVEFQTTVHNGIITLPVDQQSWNGKKIKVILLDEANAREISGNDSKSEADFFDCAGIWQNRDDINQKSIRAMAWPDDKS